MPETYRDSFTDSAGVNVTSRPTPTGGLTWAAASQIGNSTFTASGTGNLSITINQRKSLSVDVGAADHYAEVTYPSAISDFRVGAGVRINGHTDYIFMGPQGGTHWRIDKRVGGSDVSVALFSPPVGLRPQDGAQTIRLEASGSNPTTVKAYVNGTQVGVIAGYTVSDASLQTSTRCGIAGSDVVANVIAEAAGGTLAAADAITITSPETVIQAARSGNTTVGFSGTYTGTVTSIEARVEDFTSGVALSGLDWATVVASPSGGTYSFNRALPPGANYRVRVRFSNNTAITAATGAVFGVGVCLAIFGQSNADGMKSGSVTPNTHVHYFTDSTFSQPTHGGVMALANKINELTGLPVAVTAYGVGGATLSELLTTHWAGFTGQVDDKPSGFADCVLIQGEAEAGGSPTISGRKTTLDTLLSQMATAGQTTTGNMRIWIGQIGTNTGVAADGTAVADGWETIRRADHEKCDEHASFELAAHLIDIAHADGLHYATTDAGYPEIGRRIGRTIAKGWGASTYDGLGPRATGATIAGSTVTVTFNLNGHGALTGTGSLNGWQYSTDGGTTWALASGVARSGNTISFTAAGATHVRHLANANPTVTTLLRGDAKADAASPANLPVAPTTGGYVAVSAVPTLSQADGAHGHTADSPTLISVQAIAPADALHGHGGEAAGLVVGINLTPSDGLVAVIDDAAMLGVAGTVQPLEARHLHTADVAILLISGGSQRRAHLSPVSADPRRTPLPFS